MEEISDEEKGKRKIEFHININRFLLFHERRVDLLKTLLEDKVDDKLIFQISFIGIESLAKVLYPEKKSGERFIELLSKTLHERDAYEQYSWRNSLIHQSFIVDPWTTLEFWQKEDICFVSIPESEFGFKSSTEYPPESILAVYKNLVEYTKDYFEKKEINSVKITERIKK